ncbi:MAG: helix-turn-helix domain-containing protein [Pseudomonadales bacterium]|jgi:putative transcriptional regulator|nr:helix-turn-helix domain-containing protein [Pseudomonadales bacterium]
MNIRVNLDVLMARNKISLTELSLLKKGKVKGIRFNTLASICRELNCQPGDQLEFEAPVDGHISK